jgi:hypothetical protein
VTLLPVDVQTEIEIARPRERVAAYAADPDNATAWYRNIKKVEWKTDRPLAVGSQIAFVRNRGEPTGFFRLAAPIMAAALRRANQHDLRQLKRTLESGSL